MYSVITVCACREGSILKSTRNKYFQVGFLVTLFLLQAVPAFGIVLHPDGEPNLATWTDRPDANVVGRWSSNASFAVIAPNWIVTTRHQNTSPTTVTINGVSYTCHYNTTDWTGGPTGNADIRLIRLTKDGNDANLANYAKPYEYDDEAGKNVVIGGYGQGRGDPNTVFYHGKEYVIGYDWDGSSNNTRRWCQNIVDANGIGGGTYTSEVIEADFDGIGDDDYRPYEGIIALYDSGGGWFIYDSNEWRVAGLSRATISTFPHASTFRNPINPTLPLPDYFDAVRISAYTQWIKQIIQPADLMEDGWVDFADFALFANQWQRADCNSANNWCDGADFIPHDGAVDVNDLAVFTDQWLTAW
jgi:hypothetical protein